jgi:hypothetical protein
MLVTTKKTVVGVVVRTRDKYIKSNAQADYTTATAVTTTQSH